MAREAILTIDCSLYSDSIAKIIKLFNEIGWVYTDNQMEYIPLNDNDMFVWVKEQLSFESLFSTIAQKQDAEELIGIALYHKDSNIGITILTRNTKEINISLNINRKKLDEQYTDVSWYVKNIIVMLEEMGCIIENYTFQEYIG